MPHRAVRITMLVWLTIWFAGIVPGHRIGMVKVPGSAVRSQFSGLDTRPTMRAAGHCCPQPDNGPSRRLPARGSCAVCQMVAKLDAAQPVVIVLPPAGLTEILPTPLPARPAFVESIPTHSGLDPPSAVA